MNGRLRVLPSSEVGDAHGAVAPCWRPIGEPLPRRVYNTFPTPAGFTNGESDLSKLEPLAKAVMDARAAHADATLANLYDHDLMPACSQRTFSRFMRA